MVYILLAPGFEEAEALVPADLLRRGGVETALVSTDGAMVAGGRQITIKADLTLDQVELDRAVEYLLEQLEAAIQAIFGGEPVCDGSILTNARQAGAIYHALEAVKRTLGAMDQGFTPDAVLTDVESAMEALGEITGKVMREEITTRIFERFCVGK